MTPVDLKKILSAGLLSFPVTDFSGDGAFDAGSYSARLEWLAPYGASALFAAGGTGEFFSLAPAEYTDVVHTAVETCRAKLPIIAGTGGPTRVAIAYAREAERLGAAGLLLLPHYLVNASQEGVAAHVAAVCRAVSIGVIVYNRNVCRLGPSQLEMLSAEHANLIGFKDGIGDMELMVSVRRRLGDRLVYLCGMPTAEVFAAAYRALGVPVYSSAVFNFVPKTAMEFYTAMASGDDVTCNRLLDDFFLPLVELRNRGAGYAVSMVKAGARLVGHEAGPVRPPLTELKSDEVRALSALIDRLGPQ